MEVGRAIKRGLGIGYTGITAGVHGGGKVNVQVKRGLLISDGKAVAGILHLNGSKIYLQDNQTIKLGSSNDCDIRIDDGLIDGQHLEISLAGDHFTVTNLSDREIGLADKNNPITPGQINADKLSPSDHSYTFSKDGSIYLKLSGLGEKGKVRLFEIKMEIPQTEVVDAVRGLLAPKPTIVEISPEQIAAGQIVASPAPEAIAKKAAGTIFEGAETEADILMICKKGLDIRSKEGRFLVNLGSLFNILSIPAMLLVVPSFGIPFLVTGFGSIFFQYFSFSKYLKQLTSGLQNIFPNTDDLARFLSYLSEKDLNLILNHVDNNMRIILERKLEEIQASNNKQLLSGE